MLTSAEEEGKTRPYTAACDGAMASTMSSVKPALKTSAAEGPEGDVPVGQRHKQKKGAIHGQLL